MTNEQTNNAVSKVAFTTENQSVSKHLNLVEQINRKNLKIPVFGGLRVNLVVFEFVPMIPQENLVKFDL